MQFQRARLIGQLRALEHGACDQPIAGKPVGKPGCTPKTLCQQERERVRDGDRKVHVDWVVIDGGDQPAAVHHVHQDC